MKIEINKKKLKINEINGFWNRFKILKFELKPLKNEVILFSKRKFLSTYFFCQKVDIIMTDENNVIIYMYPKIKSEKRIFYKRKVYNTYILPLGSCEHFKINDKLKILD